MTAGRHRAPVVHRHTARKAAVVTAGGLGVLAQGAGLADLSSIAQAAPVATDAQWNAVIQCESGGRNVHNPVSSASGYFQIVNGTWIAHGGLAFAPTAMQASFDQQFEIAKRIYAAAGGFGDWVCKPGAPAPDHIARLRSTPQSHVVVAAKPVAMISRSYTVQRGDCLSRIAAEHGISTGDLYLANRAVVGGNPNLIYPGQVLSISGKVLAGSHARVGPAHAASFEAPLHSMQITQVFKGAAHRGIDLHAPMNTPGYAVHDGVILFARPASGFGLWVVERARIDGMTVDFVYGHLNRLMVHEGQHVRAGEQIINTGNGGGVVPHLHFGINIGGVMYAESGHYVDPVGWLRAHGVRI